MKKTALIFLSVLWVCILSGCVSHSSLLGKWMCVNDSMEMDFKNAVLVEVSEDSSAVKMGYELHGDELVLFRNDKEAARFTVADISENEMELQMYSGSAKVKTFLFKRINGLFL